jgi:hypothetical protein
MNDALIAVLAAVGVAPLWAQQPPPPACTVSVPAVFAEKVSPVVQRLVEGVIVEASAKVVSAPPPAAQVLLLHDEWTLARLAASRSLAESGSRVAYVLSWSCEYGVAVASGVVPTERDPEWEELALAPSLHDRLAIVAPEVDGAPWSLAMRHRTAAGGSEDDGVALWTTLDARAGRLLGGYETLRAGLADGTYAAGLGPVPWLGHVVQDAGGRLRLARLRGSPRAVFGTALVAGADERSRTVVARLSEPAVVEELARACGMAAAPAVPATDPRRAIERWQRFERDVRGRGRDIERVADWLDLAFVVAFIACALLLWRFLRDSPPG